MNNLEKEFVPYTEALELKQLGFDEPCFGNYVKLTETQNTFFMNDVVSEIDRETPLHESLITKAPTFSQAFRFFREKYGLRNRNYGSLNYSGAISEYFEIFQYAKGTSDKVLSIIVGSLTYEEAELACLRKLIEIVKQKQQ